MPTLAQVRNRVDNKLANVVWPLIVAKQEVYFDANDVYWQGLRTHSIEPAHVTADYADTVPTELDGSPNDQPVSWTTFIPEINTSLPAAFVSDVYHGPEGQGFVISVYARYNGTLYSRSQNSGPETWRTVGWHSVDESPII